MKNKQLEQWAKETRESTKILDNEWDRKAIDWPGLTVDHVVFEIGSFKGRWALQMAERYNPRIYCFEPQEWAFRVTAHVLREYNAKVFNFGLGAESAKLTMGEFGTDGCSFLINTQNKEDGVIHDMAMVMGNLRVDKIDICLINIEGYEYTLIPHMLERGILPRYLMVQFHGTRDQELALREKIEEKYKLKWDYGRVLACWER